MLPSVGILPVKMHAANTSLFTIDMLKWELCQYDTMLLVGLIVCLQQFTVFIICFYCFHVTNMAWLYAAVIVRS